MCPQDKQEHGNNCCKKCPKGYRVSSHCEKSKETECEKCAKGFYTEHNNYIDKCFSCRSCLSADHLQILNECTPESNTKCGCMKGFYCSKYTDDHCEKCEAVSSCPPGQGVSVPANSTHDTICMPCPKGTFNSQNDYITPCHNHTRCLDRGLHLISNGTSKTDAICGKIISSCPWMIPAGLWAGLIMTLILLTVGAVCLKSKRRRNAVITSGNSEILIPPVLPPDVIKYPKSPEIQTLTYNSNLCAEEVDCDLECVDVSLNMCGAFSVPDACVSYNSGLCRSEPQEDDWPVL